MGTDEADARRVEQQADGHASFIACGATHSSFYSIDGNIPEKVSKKKLFPYVWFVLNARICALQLLLPDEGCVLWSDKHKQAHPDKLLRCKQHILVVP